jgi:acyl-CoA synthetase (AMP-forming)/AMP-acid ligase II
MNGNPACLSVDAVAALARERASRVLWMDGRGTHNWDAFGARVAEIARHCRTVGVERGEVVIVPAEERLDSLAWVFGAAAVGAVIAPLKQDRIGEAESWKAHFEIVWQVQDGRLMHHGEGSFSSRAVQLFSELSSRGHPGLILATGGTTGTPKIVLHDLTALMATVPVKSGRTWRILPLMRFDHIGGLDMAWRALAGGQILVEPPAKVNPESVASAVATHRVEVLAATPSFLNLLLLSEAHRTHDMSSLRIVPYGAEPMPAGLVERLKAALPRADFVQRFGTSETGSLPVHSVGAGLVLKPESTGYEWKVVDGELWVQSPSLALGYLSDAGDGFDEAGWFRTGDLVESLPDGSIRVLGRMQELINVGGEKVLPSEVEGVLLGHPLVADCRVGPESNAILGQVVSAEVVWRGPERDALAVKRLVNEFASARIARHKLPVVVRLVDEIGATRNLKKRRLVTT